MYHYNITGERLKYVDAYFETLEYVPLFDLCLEQELRLTQFLVEFYLESIKQAHKHSTICHR